VAARLHPGRGEAGGTSKMTIKRGIKTSLSTLLSGFLRITAHLREGADRIYAHALLAATLREQLPPSVIVLGKVSVYGTGRIQIGENVLLYPDVHLETQENARIEIGDGVVISRGTHIVAVAGVGIGKGSMIGEYTSIRDANHSRDPGLPIRDSGHTAKPIEIGQEVWLGRGVAVLGGVTIGDKATVGANAVVTRDVPAGVTAVGIPAIPISSGVRVVR
jgi:acetyltransferase-like isoleucine patch superfamily enzyme